MSSRFLRHGAQGSIGKPSWSADGKLGEGTSLISFAAYRGKLFPVSHRAELYALYSS